MVPLINPAVDGNLVRYSYPEFEIVGGIGKSIGEFSNISLSLWDNKIDRFNLI